MQTLVGHVVQNLHDPAKIHDYVDYALPILLPDSLRADLERSNKLSTFITESWRDAVKFQFDSPYKDDLPITPVTEDPLSEWDWSTRKYILERCHAAYNRNPDAKIGINHIANFATGEGFQLTTYHPLIEELLNDFIDDPQNRIREYERQVSKDVLIDGEAVVRYFHSPELGKTVIVPTRPWELQSIETEMGNYRNIRKYHFNFQHDEGDYPGSRHESDITSVDANDVLFVAINNRAYELRGRSELYAALPWLKARKDWLQNRARINYWLSVILFRVSVNTNNQAALAAVKARWSTPPTPGSIAVEHADVGIEAIQASPNAPEAADDGRQLLMQIAKNFGLAEYFLGDGENANLASATRQQLPALVRFEDHQRMLLMELWEPMFRKVIQHAVDDGRLPLLLEKHDGNGEPIKGVDGELEMIESIKAFDVEYADIMQEDILQLTQALEKQVSNGFTSRRQARSELERDPDQTEKEIQEERERDMLDMAQGRIPMPPTMRDEAMTGEDEEEDPETPKEEQPPVPEPS
jgi:hypothetical protein